MSSRFGIKQQELKEVKTSAAILVPQQGFALNNLLGIKSSPGMLPVIIINVRASNVSNETVEKNVIIVSSSENSTL